MELKIANKFVIGELLGKGSFGALYVGRNIKSSELVAIKLEPVDAPFPQLQYESRIYKHFNNGGKSISASNLFSWLSSSLVGWVRRGFLLCSDDHFGS